MVIDLKRLYNVVGERLDISYDIGQDKLTDYKCYTFASPVSVKGSLVNRAGILMLDFSCEFTLAAQCDKCLAEFNRAFSFDFSHILVRSVNEDNDEYIVTEGDRLDLDDLAGSDILLQLPTKMLCKDDCKGLCMYCGTDLNKETCDCNGQISDTDN